MSIFSARGLTTAPVSNVVDEGPYKVKILSIKSILSRQKQTPGLEMELVIIDGPVQTSGRRCENRHLFHTLWVSDSGPGRDIGLQKLAKLCKACDVEQTEDLDLDLFVEKEMIVKIKHKMYDGEPQEDIKSYSKVID